MKNLLTLTFFFFSLIVSSQKFNRAYYKSTVVEVLGDLNKDKIQDKAIVKQNLNDAAMPYCLEIYFGKSVSDFVFKTASFTIIAPETETEYYGNGFLGIKIENGVLIIENELLRGHFEYKFRFQNAKFELIGYTYAESDGRGRIYTTDFNLLTKYIDKKEENYETNELISNTHKKVAFSKLPNLENFNAEELEYLINP